MRMFWIATLFVALAAPALAQSVDNEPPSRDDIILYLRTMRTHDMMQRIMETQAGSMQQLLREMIAKEKGSVPADFDAHFKKSMDELIKGMPTDEIVESMIPSYQRHFTKTDITAMNAFYSSVVGQKVLEQLPAVIQEGNQAAMPILAKYISDWKEKMESEFGQETSPATAPAPSSQN
jgi:uncharacterized protein